MGTGSWGCCKRNTSWHLCQTALGLILSPNSLQSSSSDHVRHIHSSLSDLLQTTESPDALHDSLSTIHCSWVDLRFGQGDCTLPPPPPSPLSPLLLHDNMKYNTCTRKKVYVRGIYFLIPLPVVNNYKNNQNYLSFLPFCLSSLNQGCPLFLTGFTRIIMKNNDGVHGITFAEHLFVLYQYFFPHLTLQGSYKFKDFSRTFKYHIFKFQGSYLTFDKGSK